MALCLALFTIGLSIFLYTPKGETVVIRRDGQVVETLPLGQDKIVELEGNTVEISGGQVTMVHADCHNQICVHQGTISRGGQAIVCAPNHVTVTIEAQDGLDAVAY